jgi:Alpha-(1->3)-arabinofuranosyltransferase
MRPHGVTLLPRELYGRLFLLIVLPAYVTTSFGTSLVISDAVADLHIDPLRFLARIIWAWNPALGLGSHTGFSHVYNTPYTWLYVALAALHIPAFIAQLTVMFCVYVAMAWAMYAGLALLAPRLSDGAKLAGCAAFTCNIYVAFNTKGSSPMLLSYAAIPLFLGVTAAVGRGSLLPLRGGLIIGVIVFVAGGFNPPLIAINIVCAAIVALVFLANHPNRMSALRKLAVYAAVASVSTILLNAYWIVPFLDYIRTVWLGGILDESPSMHNADTTFANVLRGLGQWGIFQGGPSGPWYAWAHWYASGFFAALLWAVPIIGVIGLLYRRLRFAAAAPLVIIIVSVPLVTGYYTGNFVAQVTAVLYDWAYHFVPFFQMFRSVYKWVGPLEFGFAALYALAAAVVVACLRARLEGRSLRIIQPAALIVLCGIPLVAYYPVILAKANAHMEPLPTWVENERRLSFPGDGRVGLLPGQYLEAYLWGDPTYYIEDSTFPQSLIYGYLGGAPNEAEDQWLRKTYRRFRAGDPDARALFEFLGVRMLVDRRDFEQDGDFAFMGRAVHTDSTTTASLLRDLGLTYSFSDGANAFYRLPNALPRVYTVAEARLFPGPTAAFANANAARGVLRGETFVMADDLGALQDQIIRSSIVHPNDSAALANLEISLASRTHRTELQNPDSIVEVPRRARYELAIANAASLYPELPKVRELEVDGVTYSPKFDGGQWVRLGERTLSVGAHHVRASWLSPTSAIILALIPLPADTSRADHLLRDMSRRRGAIESESSAQTEFDDLEQNSAWPNPPQQWLSFTGQATTAMRFSWENPVASFPSYQISNRWARDPDFYRWDALAARPAVIWSDRTRLVVTWYGRRPTHAILAVHAASLGVGVTLERPVPQSMPDWTGSEPGYPKTITLDLQLKPGRNVVPLRVRGRMLTMGLVVRTAPAPVRTDGACKVLPDEVGAVAAIPRGAASCRIDIGPVNDAAAPRLSTLHLRGEMDPSPRTAVTLVAAIHLRGGEILHLNWPVQGAFDVPVYASLTRADAERAESAEFSIALERTAKKSLGEAHLVAIVSSPEVASRRPVQVHATDLPRFASPDYVRRTPVELDVTLPASRSGQWLVFDETYHPEWHASSSAGLLNHVAIDGFVNGWYVPSSATEQHVVVEFDAQRLYRTSAVISIMTALAMLAGFAFVRDKAA